MTKDLISQSKETHHCVKEMTDQYKKMEKKLLGQIEKLEEEVQGQEEDVRKLNENIEDLKTQKDKINDEYEE